MLITSEHRRGHSLPKPGPIHTAARDPPAATLTTPTHLPPSLALAPLIHAVMRNIHQIMKASNTRETRPCDIAFIMERRSPRVWLSRAELRGIV